MASIFQDLRYGFRTLMKTPGFTIAALLALAIGIGANTAIFSVVYSVMLKPLQYKDPEQLVVIWERNDIMEMSVAYPDFKDWRDRSKSFESLAAMRRDSFNLTGNAERAERVSARMVSWNFLRTFGTNVVLGRDFVQSDDQKEAVPTAILSYGLWQQRFGGRQDIVGQQITLSDRQFTVIGVAPANFKFYDGVDFYAPIELATTPDWTRDNHPGIYVVGRVKPGVSIDQARAELSTIAEAINKENSKQGPRSIQTKVAPVLQNMVEDVQQPLWIMLSAVGFMLLIASSNVANLLLARSTVRQRELAIRNAMGASRVRIFRQLLTESVMLSVIGGGAGVLLALWGVRILRASQLTSLPRMDEISVHPAVLLFTAAVSALTGIIFGMAPALQASKANVSQLIKEGSRGGGKHHAHVRSALIASEIALSLVMLVGAGLAAKSVVKLLTADTGFSPENVVVLRSTLSPQRYGTLDSSKQFLDRFKDEVRKVPGVVSAGYASGAPLLGTSETSIYREQANQYDPAQQHMTVFYSADPGFKETLGLRLVRGRFIEESDRKDSPPVAVIDTQLARSLFGNDDPIGKRLKYGEPEKPVLPEIVGIVQHISHYSLDGTGPVGNQMWLPVAQAYQGQMPFFRGDTFLFVRHTGDTAGVTSAVRSVISGIDPNQPVYEVQSYKQIFSEVTETQRLTSILLTLFAVIALVLASIGIYGVISYTVTQRTHEIGVRMALGAKRADVLRMVLSQSMRVIVIGLLIGTALALVVTRFMKALLFGVRTYDPVVFISIALLLATVALFASFIPAHRATKVDPMVALRYE